MNDITMGQYYIGKSVVHRMDVRFKLYFILLYTVLCLMCRNITALSICTLTALIAVFMARISVRALWKRTKGILLLLFILSAVNVFTTKGYELCEIGVFAVTREGLYKAGFIFIKLYMITLIAVLVACTTAPADLLDGLAQGFRIKNEYAMTIILALSFLPSLSEEMNRLRSAQAARGADISEGNIWMRLKHTVSVIVPLFRAVIDRSEKTADALDVRCYDSEAQRTRRKPLRYKTADWMGFCYMILLTAGIVITNWII